MDLSAHRNIKKTKLYKKKFRLFLLKEKLEFNMQKSDPKVMTTGIICITFLIENHKSKQSTLYYCKKIINHYLLCVMLEIFNYETFSINRGILILLNNKVNPLKNFS